jgi:metal-responsive CopG/Arc/MetJ family transcriptional regulator
MSIIVPKKLRTKISFEIRDELLKEVDKISNETNNSRNEVLNILIKYAVGEYESDLEEEE